MNKDNYLIFEAYSLNGLAKNKTLEDIASKHNVCIKDLESQLLKGIKTEYEHTKDEETAKKIAMDHIFEDPKYYDKLKKIEGENQEIRAYVPSESNEDVNTRNWVNIFHRSFGPGYKEEMEKSGLDPYEFFVDYYIAYLKNPEIVNRFAEIYNSKYPTHKVDLERLHKEIDKIKDKPIIGHKASNK